MIDPKETLIISTGQALLILIEHYQKEPSNPGLKDKLKKLKQLYFIGLESTKDSLYLKELFKENILAHYQISTHPKDINQDASRRYFETHLCYETLIDNIDRIDIRLLEDYLNSLAQMLPKPHAEIIQIYREIYQFKFREPSNEELNQFTKLQKEYYCAVSDINSKKILKTLNAEQREKVTLIMLCSYFAILNTHFNNNNMPLNMYNSKIYSDRGGIHHHEEHRPDGTLISNDLLTRNQHLGLMKGHMRLSQEDVARRDEPFRIIKASDRSTFNISKFWPRFIFSNLVHPFSNSISGTMLAQLRSIAAIRNNFRKGFAYSTQEFKQYLQLFIATRLFVGGGHSLYEYLLPLLLRDSAREFRDTHDYNKIDLVSLFYYDNQAAFEKALSDTLVYNRQALDKQDLNTEIRLHFQLLTCCETIEQKLQEFKKKPPPQYFNFFKQSTKKLLALIDKGMLPVIKALKKSNIQDAQTSIESLAQTHLQEFGKTDFWGEPLESSKLIEDIGSIIKSMHADSSTKIHLKPRTWASVAI